MIKVITPPTEEPITLAEAKANLRVVFDDEDADISRMIRAARQMAEERLNRALMPQVLAFGAEGFCGALRVPRPPLRQLDSITYIDSDGTAQVLPGAGYVVDGFADPPLISAAYNTLGPPRARSLAPWSSNTRPAMPTRPACPSRSGSGCSWPSTRFTRTAA